MIYIRTGPERLKKCKLNLNKICVTALGKNRTGGNTTEYFISQSIQVLVTQVILQGFSLKATGCIMGQSPNDNKVGLKCL